jgi:hypothetical protein
MRLYAETNFLLELARAQTAAHACDDLLELCVKGRLELVMPVFSLTEASNKLDARLREKLRFNDSVRNFIADDARTPDNARLEGARDALRAALLTSSESDALRFASVIDAVAKNCHWIDLGLAVALEGRSCEKLFELRPFDAVVLASVVTHLRASTRDQSIFVTTNKRDFDAPEIRGVLQSQGCELITNFEHALKRIAASVVSGPQR